MHKNTEITIYFTDLGEIAFYFIPPVSAEIFLIDSELYLLLTVSLVSHAASCPVKLVRPEVPRAKPDKKTTTVLVLS